MNKFTYYAQIVLTVIIGFCGLTMLIAGICMGSIIPAIMGIIGIAFPIIALVTSEN